MGEGLAFGNLRPDVKVQRKTGRTYYKITKDSFLWVRDVLAKELSPLQDNLASKMS